MPTMPTEQERQAKVAEKEIQRQKQRNVEAAERSLEKARQQVEYAKEAVRVAKEEAR